MTHALYLMALPFVVAPPYTITIPAQLGGPVVPSTYRVGDDVYAGPGRILQSVTIPALHWSPTWPSQTSALVELVIYTTDGVPVAPAQSRMYDGSGSITFTFPGVAVPETIIVTARNRVPSRQFVWAGAPLHGLTDPEVKELDLSGVPMPRPCPWVDMGLAMTLRFAAETVGGAR
jgi:hypothetical protein